MTPEARANVLQMHRAGWGRWQARGRRLCPHRRPWAAAALAEASACLGSVAAVYARLDSQRILHAENALALAGRRKRDFDAGLYALDGHLTTDAAFRQFTAERPGLRLPTPTQVAAAWPEPEATT